MISRMYGARDAAWFLHSFGSPDGFAVFGPPAQQISFSSLRCAVPALVLCRSFLCCWFLFCLFCFPHSRFPVTGHFCCFSLLSGKRFFQAMFPSGWFRPFRFPGGCFGLCCCSPRSHHFRFYMGIGESTSAEGSDPPDGKQRRTCLFFSLSEASIFASYRHFWRL